MLMVSICIGVLSLKIFWSFQEDTLKEQYVLWLIRALRTDFCTTCVVVHVNKYLLTSYYVPGIVLGAGLKRQDMGSAQESGQHGINYNPVTKSAIDQCVFKEQKWFRRGSDFGCRVARRAFQGDVINARVQRYAPFGKKYKEFIFKMAEAELLRQISGERENYRS